MLEFDKEYGNSIIGIDEAGRGPLAGPVVASAVKIINYVEEFDMINDSKKLTEKKREFLFDIILANCEVGVGIANEKEIDDINILNATFLAMRRAIEDLEAGGTEFDLALIDGNHKIREYDEPQEFVIKGDGKSLAIAAASIIAKVTRDRIMVKYDELYPEYGFAKHKGYGTKQHREALLSHGKVDCHRNSFLTKILAPTLF
ncbi:ribonuclease HII [Psychrilyobacter atlanticus]|uniref:ribonuclease HII n=1 Tax=Psychrilyobacter atlanticus TaxID=271091 RepID=UPI0005663D86|nr:ribonuclease HII [Psychrilyobacter atlanticus]